MTDQDHEDEHDGQGDEYASWDAFWDEVRREEEAERGGPRTETIRGVAVPVPYDLPLKFDRRLDQHSGSSSEEDLRGLLVDLFGTDALDKWIDAGMTDLEFRTVLMWGVANGKGKETSFREAYELVKERESGKASSTPKSGSGGGTGGRSRRTSTPATSSSRGTSRT
ncbi:hypothetical protein AB0C10_21375 [Microbispora amethystogenes]|uniref:hypothetical protein n=1 Tax=Microbispora amethystogenes TaxID=1427754 RepID=UPI0033DEC24D